MLHKQRAINRCLRRAGKKTPSPRSQRARRRGGAGADPRTLRPRPSRRRRGGPQTSAQAPVPVVLPGRAMAGKQRRGPSLGRREASGAAPADGLAGSAPRLRLVSPPRPWPSLLRWPRGSGPKRRGRRERAGRGGGGRGAQRGARRGFRASGRAGGAAGASGLRAGRARALRPTGLV